VCQRRSRNGCLQKSDSESRYAKGAPRYPRCTARFDARRSHEALRRQRRGALIYGRVLYAVVVVDARAAAPRSAYAPCVVAGVICYALRLRSALRSSILLARRNIQCRHGVVMRSHAGAFAHYAAIAMFAQHMADGGTREAADGAMR